MPTAIGRSLEPSFAGSCCNEPVSPPRSLSRPYAISCGPCSTTSKASGDVSATGLPATDIRLTSSSQPPGDLTYCELVTRTPVIRPTANSDCTAVVRIARQLVAAADTYAFEPDVTDAALWAYWSPDTDTQGDGFVTEFDGLVVAMFVIRPNHPGPASHIANASYAVDIAARGKGIGRSIGKQSLLLAAKLGYEAMQFNIVISTNVAAVRLWQSLGFDIVGTIPAGFRMPDGTLVAHHIMHRTL